MRAVIDATALGSGRGGDETMLGGVVRGLDRVALDSDRFSVLLDRSAPALGTLTPPQITITRMARHTGAFHFGLELPFHLVRAHPWADVIFTVTHAPLMSPVPVALMVQDLSFLHLPDVYPWRTRQRLTRLVGHQVRRAAAVLTVSEFCRRDLIDAFGLDPDRVHVVPNAIEMPAIPSDRRAAAYAGLVARGVQEPFLLYIGNLHPRKNVARTIRAFAEVRRTTPELKEHRLVVAGGRWWGSGEAAAAEAAPAGSVLLLGRVSEAAKRVLLERADALLYLSLFEGFGLPPLEAMATSTPVVAAEAAAIPEVTGGAALLVDPEDDSGIAAAIRRIVTDDPLRAELIDRGRRQAASFDLVRTGEALRAALECASRHPVVHR